MNKVSSGQASTRRLCDEESVSSEEVSTKSEALQ